MAILLRRQLDKFIQDQQILQQKMGTHIIFEGTYNEVIIYTDKGTPVRALQLVNQEVTQQNGDNSSSPSTNTALDGNKNCMGTTFADSKLVIVDGSTNDEEVNTILQDDGYMSQGVTEDNADAFVMSFGFVYNTGQLNYDGSVTSSHDLDKTSSTTLDGEKSTKSYQPGTTTTLYQRKEDDTKVDTKDGTVKNGVRLVSKDEATKIRADNKLKTSNDAKGTFENTRLRQEKTNWC